jgi:hypothetical protein
MSEQNKIATRDEVLEMLTKKAREGSVSAAIALERALRAGAEQEGSIEDELDRLME